jgi:hypothetical protein
VLGLRRYASDVVFVAVGFFLLGGALSYATGAAVVADTRIVVLNDSRVKCCG